MFPTPRSFRARPRFRCSRNPNHSHRGSTRPGPKAPTAVAAASAAPTAEEHRNRLGRRNCRPSHGSCSSFGRGPSPGPTGRPDTSDGDMWVQQEAPPARPPRSPPVWTRPRRRLPARRCTGEATILFACLVSTFGNFPRKNRPETPSIVLPEPQIRLITAAYVALTLRGAKTARPPSHFAWSAAPSGQPFLTAASRYGRLESQDEDPLPDGRAEHPDRCDR
jgi:hypothetical protein